MAIRLINARHKKRLSASDVKKAAKKVSSLSGKTDILTLMVAWFIKVIGTAMGVFAIGLGVNANTWSKAAATNKKARQDHCINQNFNGYNGYSIMRYVFYK